MYFTQEDYRKIEHWLQQRVVRDTELPMATPLTGSETVPIIQDRENKVVGLNAFIKELSEMRLPDLINVTELTDTPHLTLDEAVSVIGVKQRKQGLLITFRNQHGNWCIHQFKGDVESQWENTNYWYNIIQAALEELFAYPDEEDVTGIRDNNKIFIKFKDRHYNPEEFSGMGRIILRKNLKATDACSIDDEDHLRNILTQEMISEENTVYIIQYDFDLDDKVIAVPKNSTLWFQGGSLNNGSIYLNEAPILGAFRLSEIGDVKLFGDFSLGQVFAFSRDDYKEKTGSFFVEGTKESSASSSEDPKQDTEVLWQENADCYTTTVRNELRWWNGVKWLPLLDITDYREIKTIIEDLITKHNAELSACYKYFKIRCAAIENKAEDLSSDFDTFKTQVDGINVTLNRLETTINNNSTSIGNLRNDLDSSITTITSAIESNKTASEQRDETISSQLNTLKATVENLSSSLETRIQQYISSHLSDIVGVRVNGSILRPDASGIINLPDYPQLEGGENQPLVFTGAVDASYNGTSRTVVDIPVFTERTPEALTIEAGGYRFGGYSIPLKTFRYDDRTAGTCKFSTFKITRNNAVTIWNPLMEDTTIDISETTPGRQVLFAGKIYRTSTTSTTWYLNSISTHPCITTVEARMNGVSLRLSFGNDISEYTSPMLYAALANPCALKDYTENATDANKHRGSGGLIRCVASKLDSSHFYVDLAGWVIGNANNDAGYWAALGPDSTRGYILSFYIAVIGYTVKHLR